jgi:uncharacterized repeat protein (TIGR03803 family)
MSKLSFWKAIFLLCVFCAVTAISSPAQTFTTLVNFNGTDGATPLVSLVQGVDGNLYGTTWAGGANNGGTVFKITPAGALRTLHQFCSQPSCADGANPRTVLVQATDGNLYGATRGGPTGTARSSKSPERARLRRCTVSTARMAPPRKGWCKPPTAASAEQLGLAGPTMVARSSKSPQLGP